MPGATMCDLRFRSTAVASSACARGEGTDRQPEGRRRASGARRRRAKGYSMRQRSSRRTREEEKLPGVQLDDAAHQHGGKTQRQRRLRLDELLAARQSSTKNAGTRQARRAPRGACRGAAQNRARLPSSTKPERRAPAVDHGEAGRLLPRELACSVRHVGQNPATARDGSRARKRWR